jgi:hypothetical protein
MLRTVSRWARCRWPGRCTELGVTRSRGKFGVSWSQASGDLITAGRVGLAELIPPAQTRAPTGIVRVV